MNTRLYVGSIPYAVTEVKLKEYFEQAGRVVYVKIIKNRETGLSRGFGFVEMATLEETSKALELNGKDFEKRKIIVKEAFDSEDYSNNREGNDHGNA